jgi:hypothetical protein
VGLVGQAPRRAARPAARGCRVNLGRSAQLQPGARAVVPPWRQLLAAVGAAAATTVVVGGGGGSDTDSAGGGGGGSSFSSGTATTITTDSTDVPLVKISWTITSAAVATSLTAAPQIDFRAPRLGVGVGKVSATLTSAGSPVAGQQITFTIGTTTLCTASTHSNGVAYCTLSLWNELRVLFANGYKASFVGNSAFLASHASTPAVIL